MVFLASVSHLILNEKAGNPPASWRFIDQQPPCPEFQLDPQGPTALLLPPPALPQDASLFLDFDGTLVELADQPDAVIAGNRVRSLVQRLLDKLDGRLAVVSGREVDFVRKRIGISALPIAGSHGQELHFGDGSHEAPAAPAVLAALADTLDREAARHPGVLVERKPLGVALHYRQVPEMEAWSRALATELAERHGLQLQPGKMMIELRSAGGDKGTAVARFLERAPFAGTTPIMVGDDLTDEPGFASAVTGGGWGVLVGAPRETAARYFLRGVPQVLDWLERSAA